MNLTQEALAERIGTRQCNISRLESGAYNPSLEFLKKVARGLNKKLRISFF
jgi:transcriptional regulator with XRE-family HTH domain